MKTKIITIFLLSFLLLSSLAIFTPLLNIGGAQATGAVYSRIQGPCEGGVTSGTAITLTMTSTPTQNNYLIATIGANPTGSSEYVAAVTETGVSWYNAVARNVTGSGADGEIWYGNVTSASASKTVTITFASALVEAQAYICEYSGLVAINPLDKTASNNGFSGTPDTGTTSTTSQGDELLIGGITNFFNESYSNPTNGFSLLAGGSNRTLHGSAVQAYLEKTVTTTGNYTTSVTAFSQFVGCIATFKISQYQGVFTLYSTGLYNSTSYTLNGNSYVFNTTYFIDSGNYTLIVPANITNYFSFDFLGYSTGTNSTTRTVTISGVTTLTVYYVPDSQQPNISTSHEVALASYNTSATHGRLELGQPVRYQPKSFYAAGRVWVFFVNNYNSYYTSSSDGTTWNTPTLVITGLSDNDFFMFENLGENLQAILDSNGLVHVVIRGGSITDFCDEIRWNTGTPLSNGTITWRNTWTAIWKLDGFVANYDVFIALDSTDHDWVTWIVRNSTDITNGNIVWAIKNGNTDGKWIMVQNITVVSGHILQQTNQFIVPLPNNAMIFVYYTTYTLYPGIFCKTWDGSALGTQKTVASGVNLIVDYSPGAESYARAIAQDSTHNIYYTFVTTNNDLKFVTRSIIDGSWSEVTTIASGVQNASSPCFSIFNNRLIIYYIWDSYHIVSQTYSSGVWTNPVFVTNESQPIPINNVLGYNGRLNSFGEQIGNQVGLVWVENSTTTGFFSIRYAGIVPSLDGALTLMASVGGTTNPVAGSYSFSLGNITTITAIPYEGNTFLYWNINGVTNTSNPLTININGYVTITPYFTSGPSPTPNNYVVGTTNQTFYFRSDTITSENTTGYYLGTSNTNSIQSITGAYGGNDRAIKYGFRVYLSTTYTVTELTTGTPNGIITLAAGSNFAGYVSGYWTPTATAMLIGNNTFKVITYISIDNGVSWTSIATHVSKPIVTTGILSQTWQFTMWVNKTYSMNTYATIKFGDTTTANSRIDGVGTIIPSSTDLQSYRMFSGDWIGFIIHGYDVAGVALYPLIMLIPVTSLYLRHTKTSVILMFVVLFGGSGVGLWSFVPGFASLIVYALLALILAFMFWRLIK